MQSYYIFLNYSTFLDFFLCVGVFFGNFALKIYKNMKKTKTYLLLFALVACFSACGGNYKVTSVERTRIIVDSTYDVLPNDEAQAFLNAYRAKVDSIMSPVVGHTARVMSVDRPESLLSNLLSDILVWAGQKYGESPEFGIYNMGGMRSSLPKGAVTFGKVLELAPFENKICFLSLKGSDVLDLFRQIAVIGGEGVSGNLRLVITDKGKLQSAKINGEDVDVNRIYRVATIDYLSEGNDRMPAFANHLDLVSPKEDHNDMRYIISDYFIEHEKRGELVDAKIEGRIVVESEK